MKQPKPKLPTLEWSIPIRGRTVHVRLVSADIMKAVIQEDSEHPIIRANWGLWDETRSLVLIDESLLKRDLAFFRRILFHELTHARVGILSQLEVFQEEVLCDTLAEDEWEFICYCYEKLPKDWR